MQWKISVLMLVAMLCLAFTGAAAAEDVKGCWEKPCGTEVEQCDQETTFVLYDAPNATIVKSLHGYYYVDMEPDYNGQEELIITAGDIRISNWHTNYDPNTKVAPEDMDNQDVIEEVINCPIVYVDVNDNEKYDLYDGVAFDLDNDGKLSRGDILLTDLPAVDVYSLDESNAGEFEQAQGVDGQSWDRINSSHPAFGMEVEAIGSGCAGDLVKWVDADNSGDWTCSDKLYLIQPHGEDSWWFDEVVTIGDTRLYIPPGDECVPECGTKVVQGDHDATYMLMTNLDAQLASYTYGGDTEWYVDMDNNSKVSFGDIRLTEVSTNYGPNTKVKICDEFDLGHDLTPSDQSLIRYVDNDGLPGYTLGDDLYLDANGNTVVDEGDIRLVDVEASLPGFEDPFMYDAWSVVASNDADTGDVLGVLGPLNESLGYIDSDCTGDWTCPDKLYFQQMTDEFHYDKAVTVGDHRLYVPVNDPNSPFFEMEEWPECGTKVSLCNIDVEYTLTEVFSNYDLIKYVDRNNDGEFTEGVDHAYIDMDANDVVTLYDVRLTDVSIKEAFYPNNTKVMDQHALDLGQTLKPADQNLMWSNVDLLSVVPHPSDDTFTVGHFDTDCSGDWTCVDALYLQIDDEFCTDNLAVTHGDIRLFIPPDMIDDGEEPQEPTPEYNEYDANENCIIELSEISAAVDDYLGGQMSISEISELIDYFLSGEEYC
ncbi:hypothetical protein [Methanohalophilus mahii]|uniref:EF-hand domain-containing protein n=1 Tax=Methanohalophilus mahii (strain ATCC 35705 / DSM 5219 / SLP) TaxID=547558 RepID=D5E792_METMS|nr:hypothetical protein [Methanohalophilus mahii]ADE37030.1 hypothetical protein Mmah_1534 [Methanohalophilus mahii DSM 5219]